MKLSKQESKEATTPGVEKGPRYPYGLCISLEKETLDKLGMSKLPKVGSTITVSARAKVESVSERDSTGGGKHRSMSLQITDIGLEGEATKAEDALYGNNK